MSRVVHVPAAHDYVRHATTLPGASGVDRTPAEEPFSWPDGAGWLARHGHEVDVLHVHFGMDQVGTADLGSVLEAARRADVAVVWTVHDLTNPHLVDQGTHDAQLALLAEHAAGLITLTDGAAAEVRARWGREAVVAAHPHLAPLDVLARPRPDRAGEPRGPAVVGVPLGLLRPATDPAVVRALLGPEVAQALSDAPQADGHGPALLRVSLREEVLRPGFPRADPDLLAALRGADDDGRIDLVVGPRTSEEAMWRELAGLAALVLPYRWGSHSGWVEACHDVGTPVVAPALGHWGQQQPVHAFASVLTGLPDAGAQGLADALARALVAGPRVEPVLQQRLDQRTEVVAAHTRLHDLAAAGGRW